MGSDHEAVLQKGKWVVCAAIQGSGVRHRFDVISAVKHFADRFGYSVYVLWGLTAGVAYCRFEELFAPLPGVKVANVPRDEIMRILKYVKAGKRVPLGGYSLPAGPPVPKDWASHRLLFSWDLRGGYALAALVENHVRHLNANPAALITRRIDGYARSHSVEARIGIRIRVEECLPRGRKPHRVQRELDEVITEVIRLPWHTSVFVATDSHYIQTMLASHFHDAKYLVKSFDLREPTGGYIHRHDRSSMTTFLEEVGCLCRCRKIINIGGFLNDRTVVKKIIEAPYRQTLSWTEVMPIKKAAPKQLQLRQSAR